MLGQHSQTVDQNRFHIESMSCVVLNNARGNIYCNIVFVLNDIALCVTKRGLVLQYHMNVLLKSSLEFLLQNQT